MRDEVRLQIEKAINSIRNCPSLGSENRKFMNNLVDEMNEDIFGTKREMKMKTKEISIIKNVSPDPADVH